MAGVPGESGCAAGLGLQWGNAMSARSASRRWRCAPRQMQGVSLRCAAASAEQDYNGDAQGNNAAETGCKTQPVKHLLASLVVARLCYSTGAILLCPLTGTW